MSIQTRVAMVSIMLISSFAMAEGSADKVYGSMIVDARGSTLEQLAQGCPQVIG